MDADMAMIYLDFVAERHQVWEKRQLGEPAPWATDPIVNAKKFTNVYRVLDHGSQFLVRELLYGDDRADITYADALMRCFLYRYTNRPEAWEFFNVMHGRYPVIADLDSGLLDRTWGQYAASGKPVFGSAYKMFVGQENRGKTRLGWVVEYVTEWFGKGSTVADRFVKLGTMQERLDLLRTIPRCQRFMSMQIVTDIGYSGYVRGDENEMVVPGPGALRGAAHVFPDKDATYAIQWAAEQLATSSVGLRLPDGRIRRPSLMDTQNTFCEFSKYVRYMKESLEERFYRPAHPGPQATPVLPEHW